MDRLLSRTFRQFATKNHGRGKVQWFVAGFFRVLVQRITFANCPFAINSAILAKSLYMTLSLSTVGQTDRIAAWAACPRLEVFSGARKSTACATAMASIASTLRVLSTMRFSLLAAVMPMETKS